MRFDCIESEFELTQFSAELHSHLSQCQSIDVGEQNKRIIESGLVGLSFSIELKSETTKFKISHKMH